MLSTLELASLSKALTGVIKEHVAAAVGALSVELARIEKRLNELPAPKDGRDGKDGTDGDRGADGKDGAPGVNGADGANGRDGADGKDGAPGLNGKDGIDGEPGKDGSPGRDGVDGKDGAAGRDGLDGLAGADGSSVNIDDVLPILMAAAQKHIDTIPRPADGKDGRDGKSVTLDDIRPALDAEISKWALDFERRAAGVLERAIERMPKAKDGVDGRNGSDGLGFDDMLVEHDGKRGISLIFTKGDTKHVAEIVIPCVIDAGFFKEGDDYEKGDGVTFGGSYWIAQKATSAKPEVGSADWRLAVRKGRDGKDYAPKSGKV